MLKAQWISVTLDCSMAIGATERMTGNSFKLVVIKMAKKELQYVLLQFYSVLNYVKTSLTIIDS